MIHVLDYSAFRDHVVEALTAVGLQGSVDEAVFLHTNSRACDVLVHPWNEPTEVWGKISFEWLASNQVVYDEVTHDHFGHDYAQDYLDSQDAEVPLHLSFHLHFPYLSLAADAVRDAAEEIKDAAESFFGDEGGVVAEVSMTSADARLECLRFEVNTSAPLIADEPWWDQLADVVRVMLDKLQEILLRLRSKFGSSRGATD